MNKDRVIFILLNVISKLIDYINSIDTENRDDTTVKELIAEVHDAQGHLPPQDKQQPTGEK